MQGNNDTREKSHVKRKDDPYALNYGKRSKNNTTSYMHFGQREYDDEKYPKLFMVPYSLDDLNNNRNFHFFFIMNDVS